MGAETRSGACLGSGISRTGQRNRLTGLVLSTALDLHSMPIAAPRGGSRQHIETPMSAPDISVALDHSMSMEAVRNHFPATLTWDNLCVTGTSSKEKKQILKNVSGYVQPGGRNGRLSPLGLA